MSSAQVLSIKNFVLLIVEYYHLKNIRDDFVESNPIYLIIKGNLNNFTLLSVQLHHPTNLKGLLIYVMQFT